MFGSMLAVGYLMLMLSGCGFGSCSFACWLYWRFLFDSMLVFVI